MSLFKKYRYNAQFSKEENIKKVKVASCIAALVGIAMFFIAAPLLAVSIETGVLVATIGSILLLILSIYILAIGLINGNLVNKWSQNQKISVNDLCGAFHYTGLPNMMDNQLVYITLLEDRIVFSDKIDKSNINSILYFSKIKCTRRFSTTELVSCSKAGNVIVGGILMGITGALMGALVKENEICPVPLYAIVYVTDDEEKTVVLKENNTAQFKRVQRFLDEKTASNSKDILL